MKKLLELLLVFTLGVAGFYPVLSNSVQIFDHEALWLRYDVGYMTTFVYITLAICLLLALLLGQWGTILGSLLSGWQLAEASFLGFGLHRNAENRLRLMWRKPLGVIGVIVTPPRLDGSSPFVPMYLGGELLQGLVGAACLTVSLLMRGVPEMFYVFFCGYFQLFLGLIRSVGAILAIRRLKRSVHLRRAMEHQYLVRAANRRDQSISCLPEEAFVPFPEEAFTSPTVFVSQFNICTRMLNDGRYAESYASLRQLMDFLPRPECRLARKEVHHLYLTLSAAIAEMMVGEKPFYSRQLDGPAMSRIRLPGWKDRMLLARYLRALLVQKDADTAQVLLTELEAALAARPDSSVIGTRRILSDAQNLTSPEASHV